MKLLSFLNLSFSLGSVWSTTSPQHAERHKAWTIGQKVQTSSGTILGRAGTAAAEVSVYLGIPFAKPPIGALRFTSPQPYTGKSTINATSYGFSCPISTNFTAGGPVSIVGLNLTAYAFTLLGGTAATPTLYSEDCLTLNLWTKPQEGEAAKAVLIYIFGGGFNTGSSSDSTFDGQFIADQEDVIVVTFNYRLSIFGFPGNPYEQNNLGLLDQRLAVEWVRNNIAGFGGDPHRITLFGQSSGSESLDLYSYAWPSDPISGLIMMSGTTQLGLSTKDASATYWYRTTKALGCGNETSDPTSVLLCMRSKNTTAITNTVPQSLFDTTSTAFWPTIDETLVFSDYVSRSKAGRFLRAPLLIGNTDYEAGLIKTLGEVFGTFLPEPVWDYFNLNTYTCPAMRRANVSISVRNPTWLYRYFGDFPDLRLTTQPTSGAYHSSELMVLFNTLPVPVPGTGILPPTEAQIAFGRYMRGAWAAFAKDPCGGLRNYGWPEYKPGKETLIELAVNNTSGAVFALPSLFDSKCNSTFPVSC